MTSAVPPEPGRHRSDAPTRAARHRIPSPRAPHQIATEVPAWYPPLQPFVETATESAPGAAPVEAPDTTPRPSTSPARVPAQRRPEDRRLPAAPAPRSQPPQWPAHLPRHLRYRKRHPFRAPLALGAVAVGLLALLLLPAAATSGGALVPVVAMLAVTVLALWSVLVLTAPVEVEVDHTMLKISRHGHLLEFDLASPLQRVEHVQDPGWSLHLLGADDTWTMLSARHVDVEEFRPVLVALRRIALERALTRHENFHR